MKINTEWLQEKGHYRMNNFYWIRFRRVNGAPEQNVSLGNWKAYTVTGPNSDGREDWYMPDFMEYYTKQAMEALSHSLKFTQLTAQNTQVYSAEEEEDEDSVLSLGRDDRIETLSVKVEPKRDTEFVCQNCHLVKPIRSQLADKKRMYCRDCA